MIGYCPLMYAIIEEETLFTLSPIKKMTEGAGGSIEDIVKCTVHLSDINDFEKYHAAYASFFPGFKPVRSTVQSVLSEGNKLLPEEADFKQQNMSTTTLRLYYPNKFQTDEITYPKSIEAKFFKKLNYNMCTFATDS